MAVSTVDKGQFRRLFAGKAIVLTDLRPGPSRDLAARVNEATGRGDATLSTRAEQAALFDLLLSQPGSRDGGDAARLLLSGADGQLTAAGAAVQDYEHVAMDAGRFFAEPMLQVQVEGWPADRMSPGEDDVQAPDGAVLRLWRADPADPAALSGQGPSGVLFRTPSFSMRNSGNRTLYAPKRSWKIDVDVAGSDYRVAGMSVLNLKSMYNDVAQMRESIAWRLFARAGVAAPRHTYAKFVLNGTYRGLFSVVEEVGRPFLRERLGPDADGNLYKAYCGDLGCATLEHRTGPGGDGGAAYQSPAGSTDRTYRLRTNEDDPAANTFDDLAELVRRIHGVGLPAGRQRPTTDAYADRVREVLDVPAFLRWAGVNVLLGAWDNYYATPANYFLYNSGRRPGAAAADLAGSPYFTFIPWDYDNILGIDYFGAQWQYADIVDWPSATGPYWAKQGHPEHRSRIPLVTNLLANREFLRYYLDHTEYLLDTEFTPERMAALIGIATRDGMPVGAADAPGLWQRVSRAAYLEAGAPSAPTSTGRQFSNDEVYRAGFAQQELWHGPAHLYGIYHYTRMRYDSARAQLAARRAEHPQGSSGVTFPDHR